MTTSRTQRNLQRRREQARARRQAAKDKWLAKALLRWKKLRKKISPIGSFLSAFGLAFTVFYAYEYLSPSVSVSQAPSLDTSALIKAPFEIKNESVFSIYHVQMSDVNPMLHGGRNDTVRVIGGTWAGGQPPIDEIEPQQTATRELPDMVSFGGLPLEDADLVVKISYRPSFWWREKTDFFHFFARKGEDGFLHWYPEPLAKSEAQTQ